MGQIIENMIMIRSATFLCLGSILTGFNLYANENETSVTAANDAGGQTPIVQPDTKIPAIIRFGQDFRYIPKADIKKSHSGLEQVDTQTHLGYIQPGMKNTYGILGIYEYIHQNIYAQSNDISRISVMGIYSHNFTQQWAGQLMLGSTWMADSDASLSDGQHFFSALYGTYRFSPDLIVGLGLGFYERIDRSDLFFPVIRVEWQINDELRFSTERKMELIWSPESAPGFSFDFGVNFDFKQYAISDDSDNIAMDKYWDIELGADYKLNEHWSFRVFAQYIFDRRIEYRHKGHKIQKDEIEDSPAFGFGVQCKW